MRKLKNIIPATSNESDREIDKKLKDRFEILESISFSIFFSILSDSFNPSGPNNFKPLSSNGL